MLNFKLVEQVYVNEASIYISFKWSKLFWNHASHCKSIKCIKFDKFIQEILRQGKEIQQSISKYVQFRQLNLDDKKCMQLCKLKIHVQINFKVKTLEFGAFSHVYLNKN